MPFRPLVFWLLWLFCALASGSTVPGQSPAVLVAELNHADAGKRVAAYRALYRSLPVKAVALLAEALPRYGFSGQNYGAIVLARYPFARTRATYRRHLDCGVPFLELTSAVALHKHHDKKTADQITGKIVSALRRHGVGTWVRATMVRRITSITQPPVRAAIRQLLTPGVHVSILAVALDYLNRDEAEDLKTRAVVDTLLASKKTKGTARALAAAFAVQRGDPKHLGTLAATLGSLATVSRWVWPYVEKACKLDKNVLAAIAKHAEKTANLTSLTHALAQLERRNYAFLVPTLRKIAAKRDKRVAKLAYARLAAQPDELKTTELRALLDDKLPWLDLFAAETLRRRDDDAGLRTVLALVTRPGAHRPEAVRVLGGYRTDAIIAPLITALNDANATVRSRAFAALTQVLRSMFPYKRFDLTSSGYTPKAAAPARAAAVRKIRAWWSENKS